MNIPDNDKIYHILVVEDDVDLRKTFSLILKKCGFDVTAVPEGLTAVRTFFHGSFKAILMDITLPGMNGIEAMRLIHTLNPKVPVILVSGYTDDKITQMTSEEGAYCLLEKPIRTDKLIETIRQAISFATSIGKDPVVAVK